MHLVILESVYITAQVKNIAMWENSWKYTFISETALSLKNIKQCIQPYL